MSSKQLTPRERQVLSLMAEGLTNREIAGRLTLAKSTVRWYARQIYAKLGAENRQQAVSLALELALITPPEEHADRPQDNLPVATTPFVGREPELVRLDDMLADPAIRLVSIVGPGGMGKTRLALAAAERQLEPRPEVDGRLTYPYPDGVWFVPLAAVESPRNLAATFAEALDLQLETTSGRAPLPQLLDFLREKTALVVVDNFEHLIEEAGFLSALAVAAVGVQLLVTSRERLRLQAEQVFPLDGLDAPANDVETPAALEGYASARLFLNTARRVQPNLDLSEEDAVSVARICRMVGGLPLGIELAASWASVLPLGHIAREIEGSLELLAAERRDVPARHHSMQAALAASWKRLTPDQQRAFQQLCIFQGGFTRPAAFHVAGATLPLLVTLVNKSLLAYDAQDDRYHIHELLRQYGRQKLDRDAELRRETRARHSAYYAALLQERASDFRSGRQVEWVREMQAELANVDQAWEWAVQEGDGAKIDESVESLARFYEWRGRLADGEAAMRRAAERLAGLARTQPSNAASSRTWARTLIWQARFADDPEHKRALLEEAQALFERLPAGYLDGRTDWAFLLLTLGDYFSRHDHLTATEFYEQALDRYRSLDERAGVADCRYALGAVEWARMHLNRAAQSLEMSLAIRRELGDRRGEAEVLDTLGLVRKHQGRFEEAERLHREVVESHRLLGSRLNEMICTANLAMTLAAAGKYREMEALAGRAAAMARDLGRGDQAFPQLAVAGALQHLGRYEEARALSLQAARMARESGFQQSLAFALGWLGEIALSLGDYDEAEQLFTETEAIFTELQQNALATPAVWLSYVYRAQGDAERARRQFGRALRLARDRQSVFPLYDCLPVAALLVADRGDLERAAELHACAQSVPYLANSRWFYDVTGHELDEIVARLPDEVAATATERGRALELGKTAEALLAEFNRA